MTDQELAEAVQSALAGEKRCIHCRRWRSLETMLPYYANWKCGPDDAILCFEIDFGYPMPTHESMWLKQQADAVAMRARGASLKPADSAR